MGFIGTLVLHRMPQCFSFHAHDKGSPNNIKQEEILKNQECYSDTNLHQSSQCLFPTNKTKLQDGRLHQAIFPSSYCTDGGKAFEPRPNICVCGLQGR